MPKQAKVLKKVKKIEKYGKEKWRIEIQLVNWVYDNSTQIRVCYYKYNNKWKRWFFAPKPPVMMPETFKKLVEEAKSEGFF